MIRKLFEGMSIALGLVLFTASLSPAQSMTASPFDRIDTQSIALLKQPSQATAGALTDAIFAFLKIEGAKANPLRDRVANAELRFRRGGDGVVSEERLVQAINAFAKAFRRPEWAQTNLEQVHIVRAKLKTVSPTFVGSASTTNERLRGVGRTMSPAEATFVALYLSLGKMYDSSYQVDPVTWVQRVKGRDSWASFDVEGNLQPRSEADRTRLKLEKPSAFASDADAITSSLSALDPVAVRAAQRFLDSLGIAR